LSHEYGPDPTNWNKYRLAVPDDGAFKKLYKTVTAIGYNKQPIICGKSRDLSTGKLTITVVPRLTKEELTEDIALIDDICDGGRTFTNIMEDVYKQAVLNSIMKGGQQGKRILIVTHAIFSAGLDELLNHFDVIYCTNSYSDVVHPQVVQMNVF
jgi:ribose-phosphate pyrophosphokinase